MKPTRIASAFLSLSASLLAACGGGGTHSAPEAIDKALPGAPTPSGSALTHAFPVAAIVASQAVETSTGPVTYEYTATGGTADSYRLIVVRETKADTTFNSVAATPTVVTETLSKNGSPVYHASRIEYVAPSPSFKALGVQGNATQTFTVTRANGGVPLPYPTTANVGEIGSLPYGDVVVDDTNGRESHFWKVLGETSVTALVCEIIEASPDIANTDVYSTYPRTNCHRVDTANQVLGHTITLRYQTETLVFR